MIDDKDIKDEDDHWSPGCGFPRAVSQQNWSRQQPSSPSPTPFTIRILILILKTKLAFNIFVENVKPQHLPIMILMRTKLILLSLIKVWNLSNQSVELAAGLSPVLEHPLGGHLSHKRLLSVIFSSNLSSFGRWSSIRLRNCKSFIWSYFGRWSSTMLRKLWKFELTRSFLPACSSYLHSLSLSRFYSTFASASLSFNVSVYRYRLSLSLSSPLEVMMKTLLEERVFRIESNQPGSQTLTAALIIIIWDKISFSSFEIRSSFYHLR